MTSDEFIKYVKKECKYYGVRYSLRPSKHLVYDGQTMSGCFDDTNKVLVCAMKREDALSILAHEYCHMTQWAEKCHEWMRSNELKSYTAWADHLKGKKIEMDIHFQIMRDLELDNEKRTVRLIKKLDLPIDVKLYTKKANAYVMFYNYMRITGLWAKPGNTPYNNQRIIDSMPDKFSLNYSHIHPRLERIFREERIGEV